MDDKLKYVILMTEDKALFLKIGFFGYSYDAIEKYITDNFINSSKPFAKRWTQMKYA